MTTQKKSESQKVAAQVHEGGSYVIQSGKAVKADKLVDAPVKKETK